MPDTIPAPPIAAAPAQPAPAVKAAPAAPPVVHQVPPPPAPVKLAKTGPPPAPMNPGQGPGWWRVPGMKGAKADVAKAMGAVAGIPAHWQAALQAEINAHPSNAVMVHAQFMQENKMVPNAAGVKVQTKGKLVLHVDISPLEGFVTANG